MSPPPFRKFQPKSFFKFYARTARTKTRSFPNLSNLSREKEAWGRYITLHKRVTDRVNGVELETRCDGTYGFGTCSRFRGSDVFCLTIRCDHGYCLPCLDNMFAASWKRSSETEVSIQDKEKVTTFFSVEILRS